MKEIKVLGVGCANCKRTHQLIEDVARELGAAVQISKVEALPEIMSYAILSTPGVVIDGAVVHAGGVPSREKVVTWLSAPPMAGRCCE